MHTSVFNDDMKVLKNFRVIARSFTAFLGIVSTVALNGESILVEAEVLAADAAENMLLIRYEAMEDQRSAGEQHVQVGHGDALNGYLNKKIRGNLIFSGDLWRLEKIWPVDLQADQLLERVNRQLRRDTVTRGRRAYRAAGDYIPSFALYNQRGEVVQSRQLQGKFVVLNFIFTRCAVPTMCPAATANMGRLQREARASGIEDLELVSISFDPDYDTPGVLRNYAQMHGLDPVNFTLLTGPKQAIEDILTQFGILTVDEDGTIHHTMATLLIDQKGKIVFRREGSRWSYQDFIERLKALSDEETGPVTEG